MPHHLSCMPGRCAQRRWPRTVRTYNRAVRQQCEQTPKHREHTDMANSPWNRGQLHTQVHPSGPSRPTQSINTNTGIERCARYKPSLAAKTPSTFPLSCLDTIAPRRKYEAENASTSLLHGCPMPFMCRHVGRRQGRRTLTMPSQHQRMAANSNNPNKRNHNNPATTTKGSHEHKNQRDTQQHRTASMGEPSATRPCDSSKPKANHNAQKAHNQRHNAPSTTSASDA